MGFCNTQSKTIYHPHEERSDKDAIVYSKTDQSVDRYLIYRDIPFFIEKYVHGSKALDYGAGTGISSKFLQKQNLDVVGVDISKEMLAQAYLHCPQILFQHVEKGSIPYSADMFDLVFSSLVLFEMKTEKEIVRYLKEANRVLKKGGTIIAITGSQEMYYGNWLSFDTNYPENRNLKSGDIARIYQRDLQIEFIDYYWTEADYRRFFAEAGSTLVEVHYPLGKEHEPYPWGEEKNSSPFVTFVAKKSF